MKVVVTGSSGRLGKVVVRQLVALGHEVVPVDMHATDDASAPLTRVLNLADFSAFREVIDGADAICHLGNKPGISRKDELVDGFTANVRSNYVVMEAALDAGIGKIAYASSIQAYGLSPSRREAPRSYSAPLYLPVDEEHPLLPREPYPMSKAIGEATGAAFCRRESGLQVISLRFTAILQPGPNAWWRHLDENNLWLPESLVTYVHVEDAARAVRLACEVDRPGHTAVNIAAGKAIAPWSRELIMAAYGSVPEFRSTVDASQGLLTATRAKEVLGFTAELAPDGEKLPEFQNT